MTRGGERKTSVLSISLASVFQSIHFNFMALILANLGFGCFAFVDMYVRCLACSHHQTTASFLSHIPQLRYFFISVDSCFALQLFYRIC